MLKHAFRSSTQNCPAVQRALPQSHSAALDAEPSLLEHADTPPGAASVQHLSAVHLPSFSLPQAISSCKFTMLWSSQEKRDLALVLPAPYTSPHVAEF